MTAPAGGLPDNFDELLLLIGRLTYSWTNTESLLIHLIAGLLPADKETAVVVFLTLNTTRARLDLVERLAKLERVAAPQRDRILAATEEFARLSSVRNRYNHSIYAFDTANRTARTILMRISDRKDRIKVGLATDLDAGALKDMETALTDLAELNQRVWGIVRDSHYPI